jgi:hypothetical protein
MSLDPDRTLQLQKAHERAMLGIAFQAPRRRQPSAQEREVIKALQRMLSHPRSRSTGRRLSSPPGVGLRALAELIFSTKSYLEIFVPVFRDLFDEYCQALETGRPWKARWVRLRGYWSFWSAVAAHLSTLIAKKACQIWKANP